MCLFIHNLAVHVVVTKRCPGVAIHSLYGHREEPTSGAYASDHTLVVVFERRRVFICCRSKGVFDQSSLRILGRILPMSVAADNDHALSGHKIPLRNIRQRHPVDLNPPRLHMLLDLQQFVEI